MAGESAGASARRMREKARRLEAAAQKYERGRDGECATALLLDEMPSAEWVVIHDVRWPGRRYANIDHIVVGPPGVFVVDSKNWSGRITTTGGMLRQSGRERAAAVAGAGEAAAAVAHLLPTVDVANVRGVLCFVRDEAVAGRAGDVILCSTANLTALLQSMKPVLTDAERRDAGRLLKESLASATTTPTTSPRPARSRQVRKSSKSRQGLAQAAAGLLLAGGVVAIAVTQPEILQKVGQAFVGLASNSEESPPPESPSDDRRKAPQKQSRE